MTKRVAAALLLSVGLLGVQSRAQASSVRVNVPMGAGFGPVPTGGSDLSSFGSAGAGELNLSGGLIGSGAVGAGAVSGGDRVSAQADAAVALPASAIPEQASGRADAPGGRSFAALDRQSPDAPAGSSSFGAPETLAAARDKALSAPPAPGPSDAFFFRGKPTSIGDRVEELKAYFANRRDEGPAPAAVPMGSSLLGGRIAPPALAPARSAADLHAQSAAAPQVLYLRLGDDMKLFIGQLRPARPLRWLAWWRSLAAAARKTLIPSA